MPTYTVQFRSHTHYADHDIAADTPDQALKQARELVDSRQAVHELCFDCYEGVGDINEIEVLDAEGTTIQVWQDDDLALRNAASELRDALQDLVERERAEAASCGLDDNEMTWLEDARRALALAKGGVV